MKFPFIYSYLVNQTDKDIYTPFKESYLLFLECCQTNHETPLVVADELAVHLHLIDAARHDGPHQLLRSRLCLLQLLQKQLMERQEGLTVGSNGER